MEHWRGPDWPHTAFFVFRRTAGTLRSKVRDVTTLLSELWIGEETYIGPTECCSSFGEQGR